MVDLLKATFNFTTAMQAASLSCEGSMLVYGLIFMIYIKLTSYLVGYIVEKL